MKLERGTTPEATKYWDDLDALAEEVKVERLMTAQEIFETAFKLGLSKAGLTENASTAYRDWLLSRV